MKFSNREVLEAKAAMDELLQERLPVLVSWGLAATGSKLNEVVTRIATVRQQLLTSRQIGASQDGENTILSVATNKQRLDELAALEGNDITPEALAERASLLESSKAIIGEALTELETLMAQEVEIEIDIVAIPVEVDGKPLQLPGSILMPLQGMIKVG